jgi:hypothetical protein
MRERPQNGKKCAKLKNKDVIQGALFEGLRIAKFQESLEDLRCDSIHK